MSKGLGRIERGILEAFRVEPDNAFTTDELAKRIYSGINSVEKKHRVAILRAARKLNPSLDEFKVFGKAEYNWLKAHRGEMSMAMFTFFNCCNLQSYGMSRLKSEHFYQYQYWPKGEFRKQIIQSDRFQKAIAKDGPYWRHVEHYKAECSGDEKKAKKLKAAHDKASAKSLAAAVAKIKKIRGSR